MGADRDLIINVAAGLAEPGIFIAHRRILAGDAGELLAGEALDFQMASEQSRRQSGAARALARGLLCRLGHDGAAIGKAASGAPLWPEGVVGSLAHDDRVAIAAIARARDFAGIGIDIEPDEDLPAEMVDLVATPAERSRYERAFLRSRVLFVAKEAVFKAVHPLDGVFLDFQDIEVDVESQVAYVRSGRAVRVKVKASGQIDGHVAALAFIPSASA
ncbi:4'-phosphopantetheinyl transferase superfamily protein [Rhodoblastus sp. 17X3]|uniref:4'-phosphopantetheinyl transferase family protein n=1 Tax=Rhodoblastus sp. 17X3 TaxID=3047026 RepID=UPI0024B7CA2E|nr:4'-phosphopantetheinyl transferase superfamily protein [Rhodoblastus sp. 17X3]MDI9849035.1 4'-phosphopantetheinyl transferase superfamily protein [Rhodoblastus sp. 17X3]